MRRRHDFGEDSTCKRCGAYGPHDEAEPCVPAPSAVFGAFLVWSAVGLVLVLAAVELALTGLGL